MTHKKLIVIKTPESLLSLDFLALTETQAGIVTTAKVIHSNRPFTFEDILAMRNLLTTRRSLYTRTN